MREDRSMAPAETHLDGFGNLSGFHASLFELVVPAAAWFYRWKPAKAESLRSANGGHPAAFQQRKEPLTSPYLVAALLRCRS